jgi:hypothetical protein
MLTKKRVILANVDTKKLELALDTAMTYGLAVKGYWDTTTAEASIWFNSETNQLDATVVLPDGTSKTYTRCIESVDEIKSVLHKLQAMIVAESSCAYWPSMQRDVEAETQHAVAEVREEIW